MSIIGQLNLLFAEAAESEPDALAWSPDLALFTLLLFIVFITVLSYFAWKPIMSALDEREKSVSDKIDSAEANADRMERLKVEYEEKLAAAAEDAAQMIAEAKKDALLVKDKILADAGAEADRQRERAIADIQSAKDAAVRELAQKTVDSAIVLAGDLVRKEINSDVHKQLIQESLDQFSGVN
ncbi:MAG: F0F1 ATP synthase subunit B [Pirellulaceae bacterium]|jgi:F-type H+-transporting ATPase subunit b|nr:F0F1 ATP synthase subunit B [Pirellulaceae bacterium]